jgi:hypothetical protein
LSPLHFPRGLRLISYKHSLCRYGERDKTS